jgi:hypothetical protein
MSEDYITGLENPLGPVSGVGGIATAEVPARVAISGVAAVTDGSVLRMGTSAAPLIDDLAGAGFIVGYFDCGDAAGWPVGLYIHTDVTAAGGNFTALQGDATLKAAKGVVTGVECYMDFSSAGRVTGSLSVVQGTVAFGNFALPGPGGRGVYRAACFNIKGGGGSSDCLKAIRISCLELKTGDGSFAANKNFDEHPAGYAIYFSGFTAAAGVTNILSSTRLAELPANTIGIRVGVGAEDASGAVYYIPLVPAAEWN